MAYLCPNIPSAADEHNRQSKSHSTHPTWTTALRPRRGSQKLRAPRAPFTSIVSSLLWRRYTSAVTCLNSCGLFSIVAVVIAHTVFTIVVDDEIALLVSKAIVHGEGAVDFVDDGF
jgi:hypothetical protein